MATTSKSKVTKDKIISWYMDAVLEEGAFPQSVFKFCKAYKINEADFYQFFGSFESLQQGIWEAFFENSLSVMEKNADYGDTSNEDKILTFFFTFFEALTLNRSYVLFVLNGYKNNLKTMAQLKGLRSNVKGFASGLIEEANEGKNLKLLQHNPQLFSEGAWLQMLFLLKFWMEDSSPSFEKTDVAIEKSVTTIFQVFQTAPLEKILDFGKFLYKESFA